MAFPTFHYNKAEGPRDSTQDEYAKGTASELQFKSMVTGHTVTFKAFITNFGQQFQSTWNSEDVFGRMDPIATFQGTKRTISLEWVIPAESLGVAKNNMAMLNGLGTMLYPGYTGDKLRIGQETLTNASSIAKPPLIKIKYANLITSSNGDDGLLGYVDGFNITPDLDVGSFIEGENHYPKAYSVSCNFTVLHQNDLGFDNNGNWIDGDGYKKWIFGEE
jgi:hypothetical protein